MAIIINGWLPTGMRREEILSLKWEQVRNGFIYLTNTKTNKQREIPINDDLMGMFKEIQLEQRVSKVIPFSLPTIQPQSGYVFTYRGQRIDSMTTAFNAACKRAGIMNFHFHDLRHSFASQLVIRGASLKEVQELLGHESMTMTLRYAHLAQEQKKTAVNLLKGYGASVKPDTSQNGHKSENSLPSLCSL